MILYYLVDKEISDNNKIFLPLYDSYDCLDTELNKHIKLRLFTENQLFGSNVLEKYDENLPLKKHRKIGRVFSIYSIDTAKVPEIFTIVTHKFYHMLQVSNNENSWEKCYDDKYYNIDYKNLDWKFEKNICVNIKKFNAELNLPNDPNGYIKIITNIICEGDHPDRLVRLNSLPKESIVDFESAKELYDILFDFTYGEWYDMNSEGYYYYKAMEFLRDTYNVDPEYKMRCEQMIQTINNDIKSIEQV